MLVCISFLYVFINCFQKLFRLFISNYFLENILQAFYILIAIKYFFHYIINDLRTKNIFERTMKNYLILNSIFIYFLI
jgi:hypothetical protein